jgi:hypothetical protein
VEENSKESVVGLPQRRNGNTFRAILRALHNASANSKITAFVVTSNRDTERYAFRMLVDMSRSALSDVVINSVRSSVVLPNDSVVRVVNQYHWENTKRGLSNYTAEFDIN